MTDRTTHAATAAVAAARGARRRTGTYKTVEVSAIDLALLLDWCDKSHVLGGRGKAVGIGDVDPYATAHRECRYALRNTLKEARYGV